MSKKRSKSVKKHRRRTRASAAALIPAKLRRMKNGTYKVYVSPAAVMKLNPTRIPGLSGWSTFAGGTGAAEGKHGYDFRADGQTYTIQPYTTKYGRHAGYSLSVYPGVPAQGHKQLGSFRSPSKAVTAARQYHTSHIS